MYVGYMGSVVFIVSSHYLMTPSAFAEQGEARWQDHDIIHAKPVSEFLGPGLEAVSFDVILSKMHNIDPDDEIRTLRQMRDTGAVFPLVIGGRPVSQNYWRLVSMSEGDNYYGPTGKRIYSKVHVELKEYADENYKEEQSKIGLYGSVGNAMAKIF